ncbi:hypothetical protein GC176_02990 [bacterium]|nr:hypothetical protein [bacterium]
MTVNAAEHHQKQQVRFAVICGLVVLAALWRLLPVAGTNFAPIGAMALFGGACFASRRAAFLVPIAALMLSDVALNAGRYGSNPLASFSTMSLVTYVPVLAVVSLGMLLRNRKRSPLNLALFSLNGSILFFIVSNFVWLFFDPKLSVSVAGLVQCYAQALPFFKNTLLSDAGFNVALFGSLTLAESRLPALRPATVDVAC